MNRIDIDGYELAELLKGEILYSNTSRQIYNFGTPHETIRLVVELVYGDDETVILEWENWQTFYVIYSNADDIIENCTISVDEILDIVL